MLQHNGRAPFEKIAIDIAGPSPLRNSIPANYHGLLHRMTRVIHNHEASTVADLLVTNFLCSFRVPRGMVQRLRPNLAEVTDPQSMNSRHHSSTYAVGGIVECYKTTLEEHLRKTISMR
jgi:hypothetical protein